jgi:micrococcal nuclease
MLKRFFLTLFLLLLTVTLLQATELTGQVSWIYDGDTLQIEKIGKVRLLGIDAPEYKASSRDRFYTKNFHIQPKKLREISRQAKDYNIRHAKGRKVRLEFDRTKKDKYDRLLVYIYLPGGDMLNLLLLEKGLATVFRRYDFRFKKSFLQAEKTAQKKELGIWEQ